MRAFAVISLGLYAASTAEASAQSAFSTADAARCGVVFARMSEALSGGADAPESLMQQVTIGLPIWEYELIASAPNDQAVLEAAVIAAIEDLASSMPMGENEAAARGDYLLAQAQACGRMIDGAYPDGQHPVVAQIRQEVASRQAAAVPVPSPKPTPGDEPKPRKRGLR